MGYYGEPDILPFSPRFRAASSAVASPVQWPKGTSAREGSRAAKGHKLVTLTFHPTIPYFLSHSPFLPPSLAATRTPHITYVHVIDRDTLCVPVLLVTRKHCWASKSRKFWKRMRSFNRDEHILDFWHKFCSGSSSLFINNTLIHLANHSARLPAGKIT